ncbi:MAG: hypothetical protein A2Z99_05765 [Treponema sp. GWB1_62_6]|nr:MAG: hypothetical protein A2Y36_02325 [Treponema sp. GWA1_62_8]OHE65405.1 MAG: hypothetical protein A2Z99_05765 [Treponema sp. GWB1_62_6]OHE67373.1 MAG: hypothetical protein A2001_07120 [Treponema sp. GWC1_61_84]OHE76012.1 MAG: hypothetical protein A2413_17640 [Treponema sp. RIFOXYC1_FULL_61_9]HCM27464.1 class IV adenylate cyclase [Treponema sp.]
MAIEIELKAWVEDADAVRRALALFAVKEGEFDKDDAYWLPAPPAGTDAGTLTGVPGSGMGTGLGSGLGSGVRIRREGAKAVVNYKRKEVRAGIEVNDEREFEVSDAPAFEGLLGRLGLALDIRKRKRGEAWRDGEVLIELADIEGLGLFVEIEILAGSDAAAVVQAVRTRLLTVLDRIGVARERIESRYYTEMLRESRRSR